MTSAKDHLMNSLMGNAAAEEEDLFGSVPVEAAPPPAVVSTTPAAVVPSRLAASGLLGETPNGLFDAIDQEEEAQTRKQQQEEEEQARQQAEEARKQQQQAEEQERRLQEQMQSIHLGGNPATPYPNNPSSFPMNNAYAASMQPSGMQPPGTIPQPQPGTMPQPSMQQPHMPPSSLQQSNMQQQSSMQQPNLQQPNLQQPSMQQSSMQQPNLQQSSMQQQASMQQPSMQQPSMQQQPNMQQPNLQQQPSTQQSNGLKNSILQHSMQHSSVPPNMQNSTMQASGMQQQSGMPMHPSSQPNMRMMQPNMMQSQSMMQPNMMQSQSMMQPNMMQSQSMMQSPNGRFHPPRYGNALPPHILQQTAAFDRVLVSEPLLLNGNSNFLGIGQPPHWSYQISTSLQDNTTWMVRRRFRHVVALEDRLRENCPGAILPPRPDKHATRAIEEASAHQSAEFAVQRAAELQVYLNQLIQHPFASASIILRLFLALQEDLGSVWPECSSNALTRLANASVGAAVKVSESTANLQSDASEDNAELLALQNAESSRIGAVLQAVPKMEGAVTLLREHAEESLAVGMEFSRVAKEASEAQPMDIASAGLLRTGRRSKRLGLELSAALQSFSHQYKLCRYERMAFADRRAAIARRHKERFRVDQRASQMMHNHQFGLAQSTPMMDDMAHDAGQECEEIGQRLKAEVHRVAQMRRAEWSASVKIVASAMKEALTERVAIWESVQENFYQTYPEFKPPVDGPVETQQLQH